MGVVSCILPKIRYAFYVRKSKNIKFCTSNYKNYTSKYNNATSNVIQNLKFLWYLYNELKNLKEVKMQNLKIEYINEIDLSVLDNEFFLAMLNNILASSKKEVNNGLSQN